jgi:uncharacterized membrane protein YdbT with pleckstrin-like domain
MAFIDKNLMSGEALVYRTRLHWALFLQPLVLMLVFAAALVAVAAKVGENWTYVPLALLVLAVLSGLSRYVGYLSSEFGVTNLRVIVKVGLISIRSVEVLLPKVEAIQIEQDLWGRVFGYGTIIITGTGGTKEVFAMIESPYEFRSQVQKQLMLLDAQGGAPRRMRSDVDGPS